MLQAESDRGTHRRKSGTVAADRLRDDDDDDDDKALTARLLAAVSVLSRRANIRQNLVIVRIVGILALRVRSASFVRRLGGGRRPLHGGQVRSLFTMTQPDRCNFRPTLR